MSWLETPDPAIAYARELVASHGIEVELPEPARPQSAAADWASSGAMHLTGTTDGPPELVEGVPATTARGALLAFAALARVAGLDPSRLPDHRVLSERAAYMGLRRQGRTSAGGATRLLNGADGLIAVTLSRSDDIDALPALTGRYAGPGDPWEDLTEWVAMTPTSLIVERGALLGLAVSAVDETVPATTAALPALTAPARLAGEILVVDLSSLWAGPLCGHLLGLLGARVVTVESARRPDPTPTVAPDFHRLLRGRVERITLDLDSSDGVSQLMALTSDADVVIESTRPRALHQLGIHPAELVAAAKACSWISITAYGRVHNRVGYGDDVAAGAGLLGMNQVFAGDAIADPLTGTHAAVAALAGVITGRSSVLDIAMYDVARAARRPKPEAVVVTRGGDWYVDDGTTLTAVRRPETRPSP